VRPAALPFGPLARKRPTGFASVRWRPARAGAFVAFCLAATVLVGCTNARPGVSNGSVSSCYRAIPVAKAAVHDNHATLIGVHRVPADTVKRRLPASVQTQLANEDDSVVCAVAFKGTFAAGQVDMAPPAQHGSYAIVLLTSKRLDLVGSVVLGSLPKSLGGRTV
jgi:hypothetical protein